MTLGGVTTVAKQEFRVRLRTGRWRWLLASWFAVIAAFAVLLRIGLLVLDEENVRPGIPLFGGVMLFVLGLSLLVAPALTAQSINGDRERGTLATVQVTRLSAGEIAVGKLAAAWGTALVFLALTLPFVVWAVIEGGVGLLRAGAVVLIVALLMGVVCAVAQALSALFARGITATLMSYLLVFALTVGTLISFGLAVSLTVTEEQRTYTTERTDENGNVLPGPPVTETYQSEIPHPELVWWLLAPNPFVILADSAPEPPVRYNRITERMEPETSMDPLSVIGYLVRESRQPTSEYAGFAPVPEPPAVWPWGLGFQVLLGAGSVWVSARRLRTPVRGLTKGVRIA
ncbi:ABC transporter permease [Saccharopolyspora erythraea]|uniref:ABC transporter permease n=1 Tax=Saccharopolyspora erythraea TaxID=1836 RepID=UPI001BA6D64F|nr:ABC transporter permease [Saccharopolyspora erythraea]QUH01476.1 ABC transporter permease [Saccharopolyspora erythraea]